MSLMWCPVETNMKSKWLLKGNLPQTNACWEESGLYPVENYRPNRKTKGGEEPHSNAYVINSLVGTFQTQSIVGRVGVPK